MSESLLPRRGGTWISFLNTGIGNLSFMYNYEAISTALLIMSASVCTTGDDDCRDGDQAEWVQATVTASVFAGSIIGQLTMGYAGDVIGRNLAMGITLLISVIGAAASAAFSYGSASQVYIIIIVCRFVLGVGVGGVFPLSAVKASEDAGGLLRANPVAAAKSCFFQVPGAMLPWVFSYMFASSSVSNETSWRFILGIGALFSFIGVVLSAIEMNSESTNKVPQSTAAATEQATTNNEMVHRALRNPFYQMKLLLTGGTWFLYDIAFYGMVLFGTKILNDIKDTDDDSVSARNAIEYTSWQQIIANFCGAPSMLLAFFVLPVYGTKGLAVGSFTFSSLMFAVMAVAYYPLKSESPEGLFLIYCVLLFALWLPGISLFLLPPETYPPEIKATFNGISAAMGKTGAIVGAFVFGPLAESTTYPTIMVLCSVLTFIAAVISQVLIVPPDAESARHSDALKEVDHHLTSVDIFDPRGTSMSMAPRPTKDTSLIVNPVTGVTGTVTGTHHANRLNSAGGRLHSVAEES